MWHCASIDPGTDYRHIAFTRALQGLGIAPLFAPVSQLAYSYLPKNKNNKASSLTNLFRNQGGSFGIAFVTTLLARRTQYHQAFWWLMLLLMILRTRKGSPLCRGISPAADFWVPTRRSMPRLNWPTLFSSKRRF
jgi:MFS family permease